MPLGVPLTSPDSGFLESLVVAEGCLVGGPLQFVFNQHLNIVWSLWCYNTPSIRYTGSPVFI